MADKLTKEQRSRLMGRVRQKGTLPELQLRRALHHLGLRFRLTTKEKLPGSPDIVFVSAKIAVFVDGCFWHGCPLHGTKSQTNESFWTAKIARNKERDGQVDEKLRQLGWLPLRFWEHEIKKQLPECTGRVAALVAERKKVSRQ